MHMDFVSNHTKTSEDDKLSLSPPKKQTLEVVPYTPPPEGRHEEKNSQYQAGGDPNYRMHPWK